MQDTNPPTPPQTKADRVIEREDISELGYGSSITDCSYVASYNWLDVEDPVVVIPGKPPAWKPPATNRRLEPDSEDYYRDPNAARYPPYPMEAAIRAVLKQEPDFPTQDVDIVTCASSLGNLSRFVRGIEKGFRIILARVGTTVFLLRKENTPTELIPDVRGYGHNFPKEYTTWEKDSPSKDKAANDWIDSFSGPSIRHSKPSGKGPIKIKEGGHPVPQDKIFDLKTRRALDFHTGQPRDIDVSELIPRLWISQIPTMVVAYHQQGLFEDIRIQNMSTHIQSWETENADNLRRLASLLHRLVGLSKTSERSFEIYRLGSGPLEIRGGQFAWMSHSDSSGSVDGETVYTPIGTESPIDALHPGRVRSRQSSASPLRIGSPELDDGADPADEEMAERRRSTRDHANTPLLDPEASALRGRPVSYETDQATTAAAPSSGRVHRSAFRSASPTYATPANLTRRKYVYAAFFLLLSLVSFVVQTETAVYIQHDLKWNKAYCMLWLTHSSWSLLWPTQLLILRIQKRKLKWSAFWRRHKYLIRSTAQMVQSQDLYLSPATTSRPPWPYFLRMTSFITVFLTMAGASWYVAVNMTSPSDLTAIYNCSAFFAYVFSILLLNDKWRIDKGISVGLAIIGVLVVAYGDQGNPKQGSHSGGSTNPNHGDEEGDNNSASEQLLGNVIIGIGSVLYGLYEVLYKKYACPPDGTSPGRGMIFANTFGSMIGLFTLCVLWIPLPILHWTGLEVFELPRGKVAALLAVSTLSNAVFSGSFLVLMSLTSPVLSSVAALLTIFLVALTDWLVTGKPLSSATITGGFIIILAFVMLSWATYAEMSADQKRRTLEAEEGKIYDDDDADAAMNLVNSQDNSDDDTDHDHDSDRGAGDSNKNKNKSKNINPGQNDDNHKTTTINHHSKKVL
ncbi:hypothetical protein DV738_g5417, partial [Chaetothyriales sp. CBS 135597]